jgi:hypothetical protein
MEENPQPRFYLACCGLRKVIKRVIRPSEFREKQPKLNLNLSFVGNFELRKI